MPEYQKHLLPEFQEIDALITKGDVEGLKAHEEFIRANINTAIDKKYHYTFLFAAMLNRQSEVVAYLLQQPGVNINKVVSCDLGGIVNITVLGTTLLNYMHTGASAASRNTNRIISLILIFNGADLFAEQVAQYLKKNSQDPLIRLINALREFQKARFYRDIATLADHVASAYEELGESAAAERWRAYKTVKNDYTKLLGLHNQKYEICYSIFVEKHDNVIKKKTEYLADLDPEDIKKEPAGLVTFSMLYDVYAANINLGRAALQKAVRQPNGSKIIAHKDNALKYFKKAWEIYQYNFFQISLADKLLLQACSEYDDFGLDNKILFTMAKAAEENSKEALDFLKTWALWEQVSYSNRILANYYFQSDSSPHWNGEGMFDPDFDYLKALKLLYGIGGPKNPQEALKIFMEKTDSRYLDTSRTQVLSAECDNMRAQCELILLDPESESERVIEILKIAQQALTRSTMAIMHLQVILDIAGKLQSMDAKKSLLKIVFETYRTTRTSSLKQKVYQTIQKSRLTAIPEIRDQLTEVLQQEYRDVSIPTAEKELILWRLGNLGSSSVEEKLVSAGCSDINLAIECYGKALENAKTREDIISIVRKVPQAFNKAYSEEQKANLENIILQACSLHDVSAEIFKLLKSNDEEAFLSSATTARLIQMIYSNYQQDPAFRGILIKHSEVLPWQERARICADMYAKGEIGVGLPMPGKPFPVLAPVASQQPVIKFYNQPAIPEITVSRVSISSRSEASEDLLDLSDLEANDMQPGAAEEKEDSAPAIISGEPEADLMSSTAQVTQVLTEVVNKKREAHDMFIVSSAGFGESVVAKVERAEGEEEDVNPVVNVRTSSLSFLAQAPKSSKPLKPVSEEVVRQMVFA